MTLCLGMRRGCPLLSCLLFLPLLPSSHILPLHHLPSHSSFIPTSCSLTPSSFSPFLPLSEAKQCSNIPCQLWRPNKPKTKQNCEQWNPDEATKTSTTKSCHLYSMPSQWLKVILDLLYYNVLLLKTYFVLGTLVKACMSQHGIKKEVWIRFGNKINK